MSIQTIGLSRVVLISVITLALQTSRTEASPLYSVIDLGPTPSPSAVPESLSVVRLSNLSGEKVTTIPFGASRPGEPVDLGLNAIAFYAALVTPNGVTTRIGDLGGDSFASYASAINDLGQAVGIAWKVGGGGSSSGFLWTGGQSLDLQALLVGSPNVKIDKALNIDDDGRILAVGVIDGVDHSILLIPQTVPEPGTFLAFSILAAWVGLRAETFRSRGTPGGPRTSGRGLGRLIGRLSPSIALRRS
jgi:hypothetical protein